MDERQGHRENPHPCTSRKSAALGEGVNEAEIEEAKEVEEAKEA